MLPEGFKIDSGGRFVVAKGADKVVTVGFVIDVPGKASSRSESLANDCERTVMSTTNNKKKLKATTENVDVYKKHKINLCIKFTKKHINCTNSEVNWLIIYLNHCNLQ